MKLFDGDDLGGPFDLIAGLPLHPLASHAPVVLVPIVAFAALAMSYWPSFSTGNSFKQASFYLDIEGHIENLAVKKALTILKKHTEKLDILGVYFANSFRY